MTNSCFIRGVAIIGKYVNPEKYGVAAEHDQIWFGKADLPLTQEEVKELEDLGWFISEDSWSCFP